MPHRPQHHQATAGRHTRAYPCLNLAWWASVSTPWAGHSFLLFPEWTPAPDIGPYPDSSGTIGFGAFGKGAWFNSRWSKSWTSQSSTRSCTPSPWLLLHGGRTATLRVCFNRDYRSVVDCIHSGTSHCPHTFSHAGLPQTGPKGGTPPHTHPSVTQQADTTHYLHTSLPLSTRSAYLSAARSSTHFCTLTTASTRMALPYQRLSTPSCSSLPTLPTPSGLSYLDVFTYSISTGASLTPRRGLEDTYPPAGHQARARVPARPPPPYYPLPSTSIPLTPQPPLPRLPNNFGWASW